jgi:hypothetical protein
LMVDFFGYVDAIHCVGLLGLSAGIGCGLSGLIRTLRFTAVLLREV